MKQNSLDALNEPRDDTFAERQDIAESLLKSFLTVGSSHVVCLLLLVIMTACAAKELVPDFE